MAVPPSSSSAPRPVLRFDRPSEWATIRTLLDTVFGETRESAMIEKLRQNDDLLFLIIAVQSERIIGVIAFSKLTIEGPPEVKAAALGPLAVAPDMRGQGVGAALVQAGLTHVRKRGVQAVCVLGLERYYRRFGFEVQTAAKLKAPWAGPHFMAMILDDSVAALAGETRYPDAFYAFEDVEDEDGVQSELKKDGLNEKDG